MRFTVAVAVRCRFCRVCLARYGTIENSTQLYDVRDRFIVIPNQGSSGICSCSMFGACSLAARRSFIQFFSSLFLIYVKRHIADMASSIRFYTAFGARGAVTLRMNKKCGGVCPIAG